MMTDEEIEQWLRDNPWKAYVVYPFGGILGTLFVQYSCIQIIDSFLTGKIT